MQVASARVFEHQICRRAILEAGDLTQHCCEQSRELGQVVSYQSGDVRMAEELQRGHLSDAAVHVAQFRDLGGIHNLHCVLRPCALTAALWVRVRVWVRAVL